MDYKNKLHIDDILVHDTSRIKTSRFRYFWYKDKHNFLV